MRNSMIVRVYEIRDSKILRVYKMRDSKIVRVYKICDSKILRICKTTVRVSNFYVHVSQASSEMGNSMIVRVYKM